MFIRSERLFLRPGWPEEWDELAIRTGDERIASNLAAVPWAFTARNAEDDPRCPQFVITLPTGEGSQLIGSVGLAPAEGLAELYYWIAPERWGQGYATEAARATLSLARTLRHGRIVASHFENNPAAGRVLRKLGFRPTGRTTERYPPVCEAKAPAVAYALDLDAPTGGNQVIEDVRRAA